MLHAEVPFRKFWATPLQSLVLDDSTVLDPPPGDDKPNDDPNTISDNGPGCRLCRDEP